MNEIDETALPVLEHVVTLCGGGHCPTVYRTDRGTYVVQGTAVDGARAGIELGPGELLVEIPADLFITASRHDN
jgi:hypothetical protein